MRKIQIFLITSLTLLICENSFSQITVTTGQTATQLAQTIVGPGVSISGATLIGTATQCGKFSATANAFPFTSGIVLTSGVAKTNGGTRGINGYNQNTVVSNSLNTAGDTWLDLLLPPFLNPPVVTHDAAVLEFDLIPKGDSIFFSYIFSSEEYNGFVCAKFFDVFGFKLSGFGIIGYKNIALVPNQSTNIPVSVNSINNGVPSSGLPADFTANCQSTGVGAPFPAYYFNNNGNPYMSHRGRTIELIAKAKVTPCKSYHLKLAIADGGDGAYDSGVFLKANSLVSNTPGTLSITNSYLDSGKQILVERCHPKGYVKINRNLKIDTTTALTLNFSYTGTATYGVDYIAPKTITLPAFKTLDSFAVNVINDGIGDDNENIIIKMQQAGCSGAADSIPLKIIEYWTTSNKSNLTACYRSSSGIKNLFSDSTNTSFLWSTGDTTATIKPDSSGLYTSVATYKNTCFQKDTFQVVIDSFLVKNIPRNYTTCSTDSVVLTYSVNQPSINHTWSTGNTADSIIKVNSTGNYIMNCTSVNGCKATDTSFIKYISPVIPTLPPTANFCIGDSVLLTANNDLGLKYKWSTGDTTNAIWVKSSATYSVIIQANGCADVYDTTIVTAKPYPTVNLPSNTLKCKGDSVWLNASTLAGSIYNWSSGANTDSILVKTSGQYIVNINLNGCNANDTADILFYDVPVLNLVPAKNICDGDSFKLDATTFTGTNYSWSTGETTPIIYVKTIGTYSVKATLGVCDAYDTTVLNVTQYPTLNLPTNSLGCVGDSVLLDATNATGTIYTWSNGATTPTLWIKATGTYTVNASLNGCTSKDTSNAVFNNTPVLNLVPVKNICAGDSFKLDATTFAGTNYNWSTGETSPIIFVKTNGTYSVKATLGVCDAYDTTVLSITQYPTLNLPANSLGCVGDSVLLDATNAAGTIYTWSNGASTPTIWIKATGTYIVDASLNGCTSKDTSNAVFNNTPVLNLVPLKNICAGDSFKLDATTFAGTNYTWSTGETTPIIFVKTNGTYSVKAKLGVCDAYDTTVLSVTQYPILNLQTNISSCKGDSILLDATNTAGTIYNWNNGANTPTLWIKSSGTYIVNASLNGCATKDTSVAIFNNTPILNLPATKDICAGATATLDATTFVGTGYMWSTGQISSLISTTTSGTYFVKATLGVCNAYDTTIVTVTQYPILTLPTNTTSCIGDSVLFDATNAVGTIYTWSNGATTPTILVKANGTFNVKADLNGCVSRDTTTIIFNNLPIVNLPPTVGFCDGDSAILNATSNIATSQYLWNTGSTNNKITVRASGKYLVDVKANGCTTRDTTVVTVYPLPTVDAGLDLYVFSGQPVTINAVASSNVVNYTWTPSFNLSLASILKPTILNPVDTTYKIKVLTTNNCAAVDFVKVTVLKDFVIPNVFSPNGDGQNDTWEIKGLENYAGLRMTIFDRYGRKVYESLGYRKPWNGNLNNYGKPLPIGTYYYIIDPKNNRSVLTGSITILR